MKLHKEILELIIKKHNYELDFIIDAIVYISTIHDDTCLKISFISIFNINCCLLISFDEYEKIMQKQREEKLKRILE